MKVLLLSAAAAAALAASCALVVFWIRTLNRINRTEADPGERRRWWWRVFLLSYLGILWYTSEHRNQPPASP
jgi:hypothetical protein